MSTTIPRLGAFTDLLASDLAVELDVLAGERIRFVEFRGASGPRPDQAVLLVVAERLVVAAGG
jgi:hypothetical protein